MCNKTFGNSREMLLKLLKADIKGYKPYENPIHKESDYPPAVKNDELVQELKDGNIEHSLEFDDRFLRCRGQATRDFYVLRFGKFQRVPDLVVWPRNHDEVVAVVGLANKYSSVISNFISQDVSKQSDKIINFFYSSLWRWHKHHTQSKLLKKRQ